MEVVGKPLNLPLELPGKKRCEAILKDFTGPVSGTLMWACLVFFAFHTSLRGLKLSWQPLGIDSQWVLPVQVILFLAAFATLYRRSFIVGYIGLLVLTVFRVYLVSDKFPMTANHHFGELYILILLLLWPHRSLGNDTSLVNGTASHLIKLFILSVYFFAGIHKLVHGFWISGEFMAHGLFNVSSGFDLVTKTMLQFISGSFGLPLPELPLDWASVMESGVIQLPLWVIIIFLGLSWATLVTEIGVPVLVLMQKFRSIGLRLLAVMILVVGLTSLELEFMFASLGCLLLFYPNKPIRNYGLLLLVHLGWSFFVFFAGIESGIL